MIFCGAPGHLMGIGGKVKMALPPRNLLMFAKVFWTVSGE
jgi:hypothetical protein